MGCFGCIKDGGANACHCACRILAMSDPTCLDEILQDILKELNKSHGRNTEQIEREHFCTVGRGFDSLDHPLVFFFQNESHTGRMVFGMRRHVLEPYRDLFEGAKPEKIMAEPEKFKLILNRTSRYTLDVDDNYVKAFVSVAWYPSLKAKLLTLLRFVLDAHLGNPPELIIHEGLNRA